MVQATGVWAWRSTKRRRANERSASSVMIPSRVVAERAVSRQNGCCRTTIQEKRLMKQPGSARPSIIIGLLMRVASPVTGEVSHERVLEGFEIFVSHTDGFLMVVRFKNDLLILSQRFVHQGSHM